MTSLFETIDLNRFSSVSKLFKVTAMVLRVIRKLKKEKITGLITPKEIENIEKMWILSEQKRCFKDVFVSISENKSNNLKKQLGLYSDDSGILRCQGRLQNSDLTESGKRPILLPKNSKVTELLIASFHKKHMHCGVSQTLAGLRLKYWVPNGRSTVKRVLKDCTTCRKYEGGPYKMPPMAPYPKSRVSESPPFSQTGLDYMDPFHIRDKDGTVKIWICLFTCMVTRADHLEIVSNMSTSTFLNCFRRFIACKGTPKQIICDNAPNFKSASEVTNLVWKNIITAENVQSYSSSVGITWVFIVELAPWMGGFYERMVGLVKRALRKTIGKRLLTYDQFNTVVKEAESVVNSRPLIYVGDDINSTIVITPQNFTCLNPFTGIPQCVPDYSDPDYSPKDSSAEQILKYWKKGQKLLDSFWTIWRNEYLTSLRERTNVHLKASRTQSASPCKVGDIVLIKDDMPRGNWRMGNIEGLVTSADNSVRSAKVRTSTGRILGRPLCLLYPIETSSAETSDCECSKANDFTSTRAERVTSRPKRIAAIKARDFIKNNAQLL